MVFEFDGFNLNGCCSNMGSSLTIGAKSCNCIVLVPMKCPSGLPGGRRNILAELRKDCMSTDQEKNDPKLQDTGQQTYF